MKQETAFDAVKRLESEMNTHDLDGIVFPVMAQRPLVVTLCGSTKFWQQFTEASLVFTMMDHVVLSVGAATASDEDHGITEEQKQRLDSLHLTKIGMADFVFVLNVGGYIGHSTAREIIWAHVLDLPVYYHERDKVPTKAHVMAKAHDRSLDTVDVLYDEHTLYPFDISLAREFGIMPPAVRNMGEHAPGFVR